MDGLGDMSSAYGFAQWALNPLNFNLTTWIPLYIAHVISKAVLESMMLGLVKLMKIPELPSRSSNPPKVDLIFTDYFFLIANSVIEYVYTLHLYIFAFHSGLISFGVEGLTLLNTAPAFVLLFAIDDLIYAVVHRCMHWPPIYPLIHKHHHRMVFPFRGYFDAANESPIEQIVGMSCALFAINVTIKLTGLHIVALFAFFVVYATTAMINHTPYDVKLWMGFEYTARAHEMHHRFYTCNYGQNFMLWDVLMGTFRPYVSGASSEKTS